MASNSVKITGMIIGAVLIIFLVGAYFFFENSSPRQTIQAVGVSTIKVTPDLVSVYFNVHTNGTTLQDAKDKNAQIVDEFTLDRKSVV